MTIARWLLRLVLSLAVATALGWVPYQAYGPEGLARALALESELGELLATNARLRRENQALSALLRGLRGDRRVLEQVARDELGMVRPDDVVFLFDGERPQIASALSRRLALE